MNPPDPETHSCRRVTRRVCTNHLDVKEGVAADSRPSANALNINDQQKSSCDNRYADYQTRGDVAHDGCGSRRDVIFLGSSLLLGKDTGESHAARSLRRCDGKPDLLRPLGRGRARPLPLRRPGATSPASGHAGSSLEAGDLACGARNPAAFLEDSAAFLRRD